MSAKAKKKPKPPAPPICPHCGGKDTAYWQLMVWICRECAREFDGRVFQRGDPFMRARERQELITE